MSVIKKYLKNKPVCSVTFSIGSDLGKNYKTASVVGDFNNWDANANPMKQLKSGQFKTNIKLSSDNEYQFRYLLDGKTWENDNDADRFVITSFGDSENSVIKV